MMTFHQQPTFENLCVLGMEKSLKPTALHQLWNDCDDAPFGVFACKVRWAFVMRSSRKAPTPLLTASTPVSAVQRCHTL